MPPHRAVFFGHMVKHSPDKCPLSPSGHAWSWVANVQNVTQRKKKPVIKPAGMYRCACGASQLGKTKKAKKRV